MKHTTFNVSFYCRQSKADKKGLAPIEVSIIINGVREIFTLPRKENPETFKTATNSKKPSDIKDYLDATQIVSGIFEKLWTDSEFGPKEFLITFGLDRIAYDAVREDSRGGVDGFQDRVCDVLEAVVKDLVVFNELPITSSTRITLICDVSEITDDPDYPCRITVGLRREPDED